MKILFADRFPDFGIARLEQQGHQCQLQPDLDGDSLPAAIGEIQVLVVRSTRVSAATIAAGKALQLVIRAGAGTNTIDKAAAARRQIPVCNVPGKNAAAVAELVMGLLIAIDRNIPDNVIDLRQGQWDKKRYTRARGLCGRHMGILGVGAIGLAVAERARAFGINLQVLQKEDRSVAVNTQLAALGVEQVPNLDTLLAQCDILSLHLPASPDSRSMVNAGFLARVQPGTVLLNAARGEIIDEPALIAAMDEKGIRVGLDVYADEPAAACAPFTSALAAHPNTYGTHHIGASTDQAQTAVAEGVLEIIDAFGRSEILHCVNGQV